MATGDGMSSAHQVLAEIRYSIVAAIQVILLHSTLRTFFFQNLQLGQEEKEAGPANKVETRATIVAKTKVGKRDKRNNTSEAGDARGRLSAGDKREINLQ